MTTPVAVPNKAPAATLNNDACGMESAVTAT